MVAMHVFHCIYFNENYCTSVQSLLEFVCMGPVDNYSALVQVMAWYQIGDKPLHGPLLIPRNLWCFMTSLGMLTVQVWMSIPHIIYLHKHKKLTRSWVNIEAEDYLCPPFVENVHLWCEVRFFSIHFMFEMSINFQSLNISVEIPHLE